jgi:hypothetical protein
MLLVDRDHSGAGAEVRIINPNEQANALVELSSLCASRTGPSTSAPARPLERGATQPSRATCHGLRHPER